MSKVTAINHLPYDSTHPFATVCILTERDGPAFRAACVAYSDAEIERYGREQVRAAVEGYLRAEMFRTPEAFDMHPRTRAYELPLDDALTWAGLDGPRTL